MEVRVAAGLQIGGAVCLTLGAFMIYVPAGFIVAGVLLLVFGLAVEREER